MPTKTLDVVIATNNKFKTEEMKWFLTNVPNLSIHTLDELHNIPDVEEDGDTLEENAIKKAIEMSRITNWLVFASDIGVDIPGLGSDWDYRRPRRILGEHASEEEKARKLIDMMKELKGEKRAAYYPLALALAKEGEIIWSKEFNSYSGVITETPDFENIGPNKGMGRLWYVPEFDQTEDKLTEQQHNKLRTKFQSDVKKEIEDLLINLD